ncbi:MAG: peptidoglycan editing factor PgeF [Bacteroidales bacterium]|nr:MAG: peptidoglycan editing factor PgeF [Bacteroidales bacterium]
MYIDEDKPIPLYQFDILKPFESHLVHFVSTRNESLPPSTCNYFTIGLNGAIENDIVLKNRKNLAKQLGISADSFVFASQIHDNKVAVVKDEDRGKGAFERSSYLCDIDAMVTNRKDICLVTQAADCVPILFYDPVKKAIGAAHAGWKGTVAKIPAEVVQNMITEFGSNPSDLIVGIGPSIGPCCYEVGNEVVAMVKNSFGSTEGLILENKKFTKPVFDLWEANRLTLVEAGVTLENIEIAGVCTKCNNNLFFSARAGDRGRFGAGIMLR